MTRQEPEGEGRASRSYSLASAPLRLLSHSFHSTANTHSSGNNLTPSPAATNLPIERSYPSDTLLKESSSFDPISLQHDVNHIRDVSDKFTGLEPSNTPTAFNSHQCEPLNPVSGSAPKLRHPEQLLSAQIHQSLKRISDASVLKSTEEHDYNSYSEPARKVTKLFSEDGVDTSPRSINTLQQEPGIGSKLEKLLLPYDIRYSIFGQLSLQDIYHCQLTCKLLHWATSDQLIWKKIALNLIQGEFYFDIPRTLPTNIPNWKFFCKRHLLRQRNWRQGRVQDVISLDDNYQKLTTLQIMAPYVLTGCDDGRVHLWNVNTRTLLHWFQIHGEITWVEHLQDQRIVAGLGYDLEKSVSEIRLFSTENGEQIGYYKEDFWDLAICAINGTYLVASNGKGRYSTWNWKTGTRVSQFQVANEDSITESLYLVQNTILELHYDGLIRLFSINGECYGRLSLDNILPNHQVSFCWLHNDYSLVVWESSNTMAHIRLPLLMQNNGDSSDSNNINRLSRPISQEEWDAQGAEIYWRHQLQHTCNFAAMGGGRFQLLYVEIFENLMDQVPIRVHSLRPNRPTSNVSAINTDEQLDVANDAEGYGWQHGEYVTAHSLNPELEKIIQGLRPSRVDCDPEYIVVGLVEGGVRLLQFAPVDEDLFEKT
ncbi:hypothetical protein BGZ79_000609 [Entomortierella chlamydospora]|nr:hypothetical protein BGZ79_000609 [Entomortierella chlamydospora]